MNDASNPIFSRTRVDLPDCIGIKSNLNTDRPKWVTVIVERDFEQQQPRRMMISLPERKMLLTNVPIISDLTHVLLCHLSDDFVLNIKFLWRTVAHALAA